MATSVIGALSVEITIDSKGVEKGLKATGEALKIGGKELRSSANKWGKWSVAAIAATTAVTAAIVKTQLDSIKELKNTARTAGETVVAFQRGAFAAEAYGISTEKYGDILKDVNDKVGDFLISGAGGMVDFFEQIAPKVGITAEAFKGLSSQESLGLYISSLEKANVTQQEMTFFMEAIAGDSTRLTPLFLNNAKAFKALTKEAKDLGIGLSDLDIQKAEDASAALAKASGVVDTMSKQLTTELAPYISLATEAFVDMAKNAGGASKFIQKGISGVLDVVGVFANGLHGISIIFKTLEVAAIGFSAGAVAVFQGVTNVIAMSIDGWIGLINEGIKAINKIYDTGISEIPEVRDSSFVNSVNKVAENMVGLVKKTNGELHDLAMETLPSENIKAFADSAITEYNRIAQGKVDADKKAKEEKPDAEGAGIKVTSEKEVLEAESLGIFEILGVRYQTEEQLQLESLEKQRLAAQMAFNNGEVTAIEHADKMAEIKQAEEDTKRALVESSVSGGIEFLARNSKKAQKLLRVAAVANAIIAGQEAAVHSFNAGAKLGGPIVGAAFAALSIANTAGMIAKIKGGGKSSTAPSGSTPVLPEAGGSSGSQGAQQPTSPRNISINMQGGSMFNTEQVRELIGQINSQVGDGVELVTTGQ